MDKEKINLDEVWVEHPIGVKVSDKGQVYWESRRYPNGHFTFGSDNGKGYKKVNYKGKLYLVHRLVAECFLPNINNYAEVNHIDEDKSNNNINNLEWCTHLYNMNFGTRTERTSKKVIQMTLDGNVVKEWASTIEAERHGFNHSAVSNCCNNKRKTHKGYKWKWAS